ITSDKETMNLFGTVYNRDNGRIWNEQNTTKWVHLDSASIAVERQEYALTEDDVQGPRWDATLIVRGRVTQGDSGRLRAKVELRDGAAVIATTYAAKDGSYSRRARARAVRAEGYTVRAEFSTNYPFQRPLAHAGKTLPIEPAPVPFSYPGEE